MLQPEPFRIDGPDVVLVDLKARSTRFLQHPTKLPFGPASR